MTILAKNDQDVSGEFLNVSITHNITDLTYLHAHMQNGLFFHEIKNLKFLRKAKNFTNNSVEYYGRRRKVCI